MQNGHTYMHAHYRALDNHTEGGSASSAITEAKFSISCCKTVPTARSHLHALLPGGTSCKGVSLMEVMHGCMHAFATT